MAKAQGKKAAAGGKSAAKKVAARVKGAVATVKKKVAKKPPAPKARPASTKTPAKAPASAKRSTPRKQASSAKATPAKGVRSSKAAVSSKGVAPPKPAARPKPAILPQKAAAPAKKAAEKVKQAAKTVTRATKQVVAKVAQSAAQAPAAKARPAAPAIPKPVPAKGAKPGPPVAPNVPAVPPPAAAESEKKRGRRARTRVHSSGAPAAAWLSSEKPRPASFIPAPPRAEAPSAVAAPPASSDRLLRPDDVAQPAVRTVPVRIDVEQGAGRFYVIASPPEVTLRVGEGIEWDFRYICGADVASDEVIVEFERPSPFPQIVYRTRKPGGARPHRQLSGGALPSAAGKRVQYSVRAMNAFKTELASTKIWVNVTA